MLGAWGRQGEKGECVSGGLDLAKGRGRQKTELRSLHGCKGGSDHLERAAKICKTRASFLNSHTAIKWTSEPVQDICGSLSYLEGQKGWGFTLPRDSEAPLRTEEQAA